MRQVEHNPDHISHISSNLCDLILTLSRLTDHSILSLIQAADISPLSRVAVQSHTCIQGYEVRWRRAVLPVTESYWLLT